MSKSTRYVENDDETTKYLATMVKQAEKHGIKILAIAATVPMIGRSMAGLTCFGYDDLLETSSKVNDLQIQILKAHDMKRKETQIKQLDDFIDSLLGDDDEDD